MAKRTPKSPSKESLVSSADTPPSAESPRKVRSGGRARGRKDVASEMATGQDQAAAESDQFVGVERSGEEPVQGSGAPAAASAASIPESAPESVSMSSGPSDQDIRMRAYHRYLERGGGHGMDFEDWLEAERDLKARS
jgi:hypothetical protein